MDKLLQTESKAPTLLETDTPSCSEIRKKLRFKNRETSKSLIESKTAHEDSISDTSSLSIIDDSDLDTTWLPDKNRVQSYNFLVSDSEPELQDLHKNITKENLTISESDPEENDTQELSKTSRWKKRNSANWARNIIKKQRNECLPYQTKKGMQPPKAPKPIQCYPPCRFKCSSIFDDDERTEICKLYWKLESYNRKKDFILKFVKRQEPKRRLLNSKGSKNTRSCSKQYFLLKNGVAVRVCEQFFLKTLCISNGPVNKAFEESNTVTGTFIGEDKRGKKSPQNKTKLEDIAIVKNHIEQFPVTESHYCRRSTKRLYLDPTLSINKMYELYVKKCVEDNATPVGKHTYRKIFCTHYNLSFFVPKKDQCSICNKANSLEITDEFRIKIEEHLQRRDDANKAKELDKSRSENDPNFISATFDLQKVLQIPKIEDPILYYCRKLNVYNLTLYESRTPNEAFCYCWTEINGRRGSNEIGTCIFEWIRQLPPEIKEISLFSDTCSGQNRNQHMAALFLALVQVTNLQKIEHKFLESGHSHMEVDSMHSAIENQQRHISVFSMIDWLNIFKLARSSRKRKTARPYKVKELKFDDFYDLTRLSKSVIKNKTTDDQGHKIKWLKIKRLCFEKNLRGVIKYSYNYFDPYLQFHIDNYQTREKQESRYEMVKAYNKEFPISEAKKKDLLKLCYKKVIPEELHLWYQNIKSSASVIDRVMDPAVQDSTDGEVED